MDFPKIEQFSNLNKILITREESTFFARVGSNTFKKSGIYPGDLLIIDKSLYPRNQGLAVVIWKEKFVLRRLVLDNSVIYLNCDINPEIRVDTRFDPDFQVWGMVTFVIHTMITGRNRH